MAITKVGPPLAGIRGTIGGIVYSEGKSGTYARLWSKGSNPRSPEQMRERGYLARMPALWADLTDLQRAAWRTFADDPAQELENPLGENYFASGYNWFTKCNIRLLRVGRAPIVPVPAQARPAAPTILEFRVTPAGTETDQCICGVVTSSSQEPGFPPAQAFDDNVATTWSTVQFQTTGWLEYQFCAPVVIRKYRIYAPVGLGTRAPKDWKFQGLDNGGWFDLDTITDYVFVEGAWNTFYCQNLVSYEDYRIHVSANNGSADYLAIYEMEMYLGIEDSSVIVFQEDNFDNAPDYDLVMHVSMGRSIGMDVQYPGFLETLAQQGADRHYEECQSELEANFGALMADRSWFGRLYRQTREGLRSAAAAERTVTT
ncbi:hypothetical protein ES703_64644 [subsurface metagenome]